MDLGYSRCRIGAVPVQPTGVRSSQRAAKTGTVDGRLGLFPVI